MTGLLISCSVFLHYSQLFSDNPAKNSTRVKLNTLSLQGAAFGFDDPMNVGEANRLADWMAESIVIQDSSVDPQRFPRFCHALRILGSHNLGIRKLQKFVITLDEFTNGDIPLNWYAKYLVARNFSLGDLKPNLCSVCYGSTSILEPDIQVHPAQCRPSVVQAWWRKKLDNGGLRGLQLLPVKRSLLLNLSERVMGSLRRPLVGAIDSSGIDGVGNQKSEPNQFSNKFGVIPAIALCFAGYFIAGVGWFGMHFNCRSGRDAAGWAGVLVIGILISLYGGWHWLIVGRIF